MGQPHNYLERALHQGTFPRHTGRGTRHAELFQRVSLPLCVPIFQYFQVTIFLHKAKKNVSVTVAMEVASIMCGKSPRRTKGGRSAGDVQQGK